MVSAVCEILVPGAATVSWVGASFRHACRQRPGLLSAFLQDPALPCTRCSRLHPQLNPNNLQELHPDEPGGGASGTVCSLAVDLAVPALTPEQVAAIEARANDEV